MAGAKTYNLANISVSVNGNIVDGFGPGDVVTVARTADMVTQQNGADGEVVQSISNNRTGTMAFTLLYSSESNQLFTELARQTETTGQGLASINLEDSNGGAIVSAKNCRVQKIPDFTFGEEAGTLEWTWLCADLDIQYLGLPDETPTP